MNVIQIEFFAAVEAGHVEQVRALLEQDPTLAQARDEHGATALHHAAFNCNREMIALIHSAGADINARDAVYDATPTGWAFHSLRERGALLAIEVEDVLFAIDRGDVAWARRLVTRHPALLSAVDRNGTPLAVLAARRGDPELAQLFDPKAP